MSPKHSHEDPAQVEVVVPGLTMKDLLDVIPAHCFKRSAVWSMAYVVWDLVVITALWNVANFGDAWVKPENVTLPHPALYSAARFAIWAVYSFFASLFAFGLWICAHEAGHGSFSDYKFLNNAVGWVLHSGLGVPYFSWKISHAKHHAACCHVDQDQIYIPKTRKEHKLAELDESKDDLDGNTKNVSQQVKDELYEALSDSPIGATATCFVYLVAGLPMYLTMNSSGQRRYPKWASNHFNPGAVMFAKHQYGQIVISAIGIALWLAIVGVFIHLKGFQQVFRSYIVVYMWVNHWLVLITFLQHTDPLVPHYRAESFTFTRGALSTLDRSLLGDYGKWMGALAAHATHGISETHVLHHVCSKIPHYHAWEASDLLRAKLASHGIHLQGAPGGWREFYRVFRECRFIEDEGGVVFYKNSRGVAAGRPVDMIKEDVASDSGVEVNE